MTRIQLHIAMIVGTCIFALGTTPSQAEIILDASADTYVWHQNGDTNYGSQTSFVVANDGGSAIPKTKDRLGVLRFDLSSVTGPITSASCALTSDTDFEFRLYGINDGGADENFDELALTFNTFDYAATSTYDGSLNPTGLTLLASGITDASDGSSDNVLTFNTTDLLNFINADTNDIVTFVLFHTAPQNGNTATFASREAASGQPKLSLVPEPASLALLGLGGLMLLPARKGRQ